MGWVQIIHKAQLHQIIHFVQSNIVFLLCSLPLFFRLRMAIEIVAFGILGCAPGVVRNRYIEWNCFHTIYSYGSGIQIMASELYSVLVFVNLHWLVVVVVVGAHHGSNRLEYRVGHEIGTTRGPAGGSTRILLAKRWRKSPRGNASGECNRRRQF